MRSTSCIKKNYKPAIKKNAKKPAKEKKLADMGLFELSFEGPMPDVVFRELRNRIELMQKSIMECQKSFVFHMAEISKIINGLMKGPQDVQENVYGKD